MATPPIPQVPFRGADTAGPPQGLVGTAPTGEQAGGAGAQAQDERLKQFLLAVRRWLTEFEDFSRALPETAEVLRDMKEKAFEAMARAAATQRQSEDALAGTPKVIGP